MNLPGLNLPQLNISLSELNMTLSLLRNMLEVPQVTGEVDIHGNHFARNTAGGPSAGGCSVGAWTAAGGALDLMADNAAFQDNLLEENEACGCAWSRC
jgi:hypothetical protein